MALRTTRRDVRRRSLSAPPMALGDWCISIIPLRGLSEGMTNATRCVPTLIAGQDMEWSRCFSRYIPLSVETLRATSPFGYVRDACNVSVWIVSGYVGDVGATSLRGGGIVSVLKGQRAHSPGDSRHKNNTSSGENKRKADKTIGFRCFINEIQLWHVTLCSIE